MVKICRAQSGQEKFKDPHIQEMDETSFCYPVISQGLLGNIFTGKSVWFSPDQSNLA